ncbi:hypothetical protein HHK36_027172 [Tetracentron sinense]|uniref:Uncharacterized protein n=1 Tax=Tetracentron sinense TaxID=13715 RepID=A0A834YGD3_TETSI|nr:hypothetical protein HHK36_027172 [Tetracentron sinense]
MLQLNGGTYLGLKLQNFKRLHFTFSGLHVLLPVVSVIGALLSMLEQKRLNDLVFVQYNQRLRERFLTRKENLQAYDPICFDEIDETSEWVTGKDPSEEVVYEGDNLRWLDVDAALDASGGSQRPRRNTSRSQSKSSTSKGKSIAIVRDDDETQPPEEPLETLWEDFGELESEEEDLYY